VRSWHPLSSIAVTSIAARPGNAGENSSELLAYYDFKVGACLAPHAVHLECARSGKEARELGHDRLDHRGDLASPVLVPGSIDAVPPSPSCFSLSLWEAMGSFLEPEKKDNRSSDEGLSGGSVKLQEALNMSLLSSRNGERCQGIACSERGAVLGAWTSSPKTPVPPSCSTTTKRIGPPSTIWSKRRRAGFC
jgi:hypothetical protein